MREATRTFYQQAVQAAVARIAAGLDGALDLTDLARPAALSPLHFHHVFRGLLGETPLALHRRLRLERAAWRMAHGAGEVTSVAFEAGYETHESFTRAFRAAYAASPSELRQRARQARKRGTRLPATGLAARCGVHFSGPGVAPPVTCFDEEILMPDVQIETMPELCLAAVSHRGPYASVSEAFQRLDEIVRGAPSLERQVAGLVAIYHDDPETVPAAELRADAGVMVPPRTRLPEGLTAIRIPAGRYARMVHVGPYDRLGDAWSRLLGGWLARSGHRAGTGPAYEKYLNTPATAAPAELRTELYLPLA
jgi:AraC family transcriptional regulator